MMRRRWGYNGPGSWGYAFVKCLRCTKSTPRNQPLCVECQQKQQRHAARRTK